MQVKNKRLLAEIPVNGTCRVGIYQGDISEYDILIKYRQLLENGKWSRIRTPKHIHWAVDIMIKHYCDAEATDNLLDFLLRLWNNSTPITNDEERNVLLNTDSLIEDVNREANQYASLAQHGEYSIKFLILIAKLLMIQEKTNRQDAYMFKRLLEQLREHNDIFRIVSTATYH